MSSNRTFKRNLKTEKKRIDSMLKTISSKTTKAYQETSSLQYEVVRDNLEQHFTQDLPQSLREKLKNWFIEYNPSVQCCTSLLKILKSENIDVPTSVGGLMQRNEKCVSRTVAPGKYIHIGLQKQLQKGKEIILQHNGVLQIDVGIDGLPLYKSSAVGLWPILGKIVDEPRLDVFLIGTYIGKSKPIDVNIFLHDFVEEMKSKSMTFEIGEKSFRVQIRAFICDAPARSFLCQTKGHNALNGCHRCHQIGSRIGHRTVFSNSVGPRRTDFDFKTRMDVAFHKDFGLVGESKLESLGIGMVTQFPLDCMHLIDLGVTKKILVLLLSNKTNQKIPTLCRSQMSSVLVSFAPFVTLEFVRKPRTLDEMNRWKSVEFRQVVLYTGIVLLKDFVDEEFYKHFCLLVVGYRLFVGSKIYNDDVTYDSAEQMLSKFVQDFPKFYGTENLSYNIHNLLHIADCYKEFGNLMNYSAYEFENYLKKIKQSIKMPKHIHQQIFNNFNNKNIILASKNHDTVIKNGVVKSIFVNGSTFKTKAPDNLCCISNKIYMSITFIGQNGCIKGKQFLNLENFFLYPLQSLDIGIAYSRKLEISDKEETYNLEEIAKIMLLPYKDFNMYKQYKKPSDFQELIKMMQILQNKIDVLSENVNKINSEFDNNKQTVQNDLKEIKNQNTVILDVLAENTTAMKGCLKNNVPKHTKMFPISSVDEFKKVEDELNEENEKEYIASVRAICGQRGLRKGLRELITPEILDMFNLDGTHNKLRLLNFPKFMHILFAGTYCEGSTDKSFKAEIRDALKLAKNHFCKEKKKNCSKENTAVVKENDFFEKHYTKLINL